MMRILVSIDTELSPVTQQVLRTVSEFVEQASPQVFLLLLNVIPMTQTVVAHPGWYIGQDLALAPTSWQRAHAEEILRRAGEILQGYGVSPERTQYIVRVGATAEEIVKAARELHVSLIVVGSRGNTWKQRLRRLLIGSISRAVIRSAPCPVMLVIPPSPPRNQDLVAWYEGAIKQYLSEHTDSLMVLTPQQVAQQFTPPSKKIAGHKEIAAAILALERLTNAGILCRHNVKGEPRYVND
ncbi:MAG: universal stress protein [Ktedonobacteraceae bacterium]|nr:universal stress protein [Ktedonobacteraceae bacterium]